MLRQVESVANPYLHCVFKYFHDVLQRSGRTIERQIEICWMNERQQQGQSQREVPIVLWKRTSRQSESHSRGVSTKPIKEKFPKQGMPD